MRVRRVRGTIAALLLSVASAGFSAKTVPAPVVNPATGVSDQELRGALSRANAAIAQQDCGAVLTALDPLVPHLMPGTQRVAIQRMRLACLGAQGRAAELPVVQKELLQALPKDNLVLAIGVLIAADENRFTDAAAQITSIASKEPGALEILNGSAVYAISQRLNDQHLSDVRGKMLIALAQADWQPADLPDLRESFTAGAIDALVGQHRQSEAEQLLDRIDQPEMLTGMAIDRRYTALWPSIETLLGPGSTSAVDHYAQNRLAVYSESARSDIALRDATDAMLLLHRFQDVLDMTNGLVPTNGISRDAIRTILYRARALEALGQIDEADKLLGGFLKIDVATAPEMSTALVSYAEMLDENGREQKALDVVAATRMTAWNTLSDYGKRWIDRTEVCALSAMGRAADADKMLKTMTAKADQNKAAMIEALLCAKHDGEAAALLATSFGDSDVADNLVLQFQPAGSMFATSPSRLRDLWIAFLARPDVKAAFEKHGRILPRTLWPQQIERPLPPRILDGSTLT